MARMNFKNFKPIAQDAQSYTIEHPSGKRLFIEKAKLNQGAHKEIQCMFQGGISDGEGEQDSLYDTINKGFNRGLKQGVNSVFDSFSGSQQNSAVPQVPVDEGQSRAYENNAIARSPGSVKSEYAQNAPDLTAQDIADLDAPVKDRNGNVITKFGRDENALAKMKSQVDSAAPPAPASQQSLSLPPMPQDQPQANGDPLLQEKSGIQDLLAEQIKNQEAAMNAQQSSGQEIARIQQQGADELAKIPTLDSVVAQHNAKDMKLAQAYMDKKIDGQRYIKNMGNGSKILTGIAMVLSGMGSATTGQPNYAVDVIKDAIKRDTEEQRSDKEGAKNLWQMNRAALGSDIEANLATRNQKQAWVLAQLQAAQTRTALPQEKLRAQQAIDQLKMDMLQNNLRRGLLAQGAAGAQAGGPGALSGADPAVLVPEMVKDPAQQKQVYEEIRNRANIVRNGGAMLKAFDQAANEVSGAGGVIHSAIEKTPGQLALDQLMKPNMSELDGTIRHEAVVGAQETMIPSFKDLGRPDRIASKRQSLIDWMKSQQETPVSKGNYIDLDRFQKTAIPSDPAKKQAVQPQTIERRAKDGRIIIYDANTKQPIGVKK